MLSEWEEHGNAVMHVVDGTHRVQWKMTATRTMRIISWYLAARGYPR